MSEFRVTKSGKVQRVLPITREEQAKRDARAEQAARDLWEAIAALRKLRKRCH